MPARYRYRAYPTPGQAQMVARTFGCARVVFNDAIRAREKAHAAREEIGDTEAQRRVITLAKATEERGWLWGRGDPCRTSHSPTTTSTPRRKVCARP